jgi:hypothetical protein
LENYTGALQALHNYCEKEAYRGYNLLDSHLSPVPFKKFGHPISFLINQVFRRSPINFRPIAGIKKSFNPKAMGLFLYSYVKIKEHGLIEVKDIDEVNHQFFKWLTENNSKGYSGYCWGYHYDWPNRDGSCVPAHTPCGVVSSVIIRAIFNYYQQYKIEKAKEVISSAAQFVLKDLKRTDTKFGLCFS